MFIWKFKLFLNFYILELFTSEVHKQKVTEVESSIISYCDSYIVVYMRQWASIVHFYILELFTSKVHKQKMTDVESSIIANCDAYILYMQ